MSEERKVRSFGSVMEEMQRNVEDMPNFNDSVQIDDYVVNETGREQSSLTDKFGSVDGDSGYTEANYVEENTDLNNPIDDTLSTDSVIEDDPGFNVIDISNEQHNFFHEWNPNMNTLNYIGNKDLLLNYLKDLEQKFKVTMPIKACGIDPIVFGAVDYLSDPDTEKDLSLFVIPNNKQIMLENENNVIDLYELIQIDDELYLSGVSKCLDEEYLRSVFAEATISVKTTGSYTYQMVGLRKLALEEGQEEGRLLNTLKLNSYEMSVLINYMNILDNMKVSFIKENGKQCIHFSIK